MLYFVVSHLMNSVGSLMWQLPRRHGKSWRSHMKAPKRWKIQSYKCLPLTLKNERWVKMSYLTPSMENWMKWWLTSLTWARRRWTPNLLGRSYDHYWRDSMPRSPPSKRAKTLMRLKFKNLSVLFKLMNYLYHHKGRANLLLSRQ